MSDIKLLKGLSLIPQDSKDKPLFKNKALSESILMEGHKHHVDLFERMDKGNKAHAQASPQSAAPAQGAVAKAPTESPKRSMGDVFEQAKSGFEHLQKHVVEALEKHGLVQTQQSGAEKQSGAESASTSDFGSIAKDAFEGTLARSKTMVDELNVQVRGEDEIDIVRALKNTFSPHKDEKRVVQQGFIKSEDFFRVGEGSKTTFYFPTHAAIKNNANNRSAQNYNEVIDQFVVGVNHRYQKGQQGGSETYCNIFVWDVTRAMGAEIPFWTDKKGNAITPPENEEHKTELLNKGYKPNTANDMHDWLEKNGAQNGWIKVTADDAQKAANKGQLTVASWKNTEVDNNGKPRSGHVGIVRPGKTNKNGPALAQAGRNNFNKGHVKNGFGQNPVSYWVHNPTAAAAAAPK
ncbi:MAG: hypothetical protein FWG75_05595 [Cystobacterineae bacterium]|nr:hypothetical protein [Cystobacterineae bacterium]